MGAASRLNQMAGLLAGVLLSFGTATPLAAAPYGAQQLPPLFNNPSCAPGYHPQGTSCVPNVIVIDCAPGYHPQGTTCVPNPVVVNCAPGFHPVGHSCVPNNQGGGSGGGSSGGGSSGGGSSGGGGSGGGGSGGSSGGSSQRPPDPQVLHVQQCLSTLGYDPGPIDGLSGRSTTAAFTAFQNANGLGNRPANIADQASLTALFQLCENPQPPEPATVESPVQIEPPPPPSQPPQAVDQPTNQPPPPAEPPPPSLEACVDSTLIPALMAAYPGRQAPPECQPHCLPPPADRIQSDLDAIAQRHAITWCNACIPLQSYVRPDVIRQIEFQSQGRVTLCGGPPVCFIPPPSVMIQVDTIFVGYPVGIGNDNDKKIAVIIGNENYNNDVMPNPNGINDADAMDRLLLEHLGYRRANIIDLRDAKLADLQRVLGSRENPAGELAKRVGPNGDGVDVMIYVASHGITGQSQGDNYILPVDGLPEDPAGTAYSFDLLYDNLAALHARTTMLFVEARFGPVTDIVEPANVPTYDVDIFPKAPVPGLAVIKATDGNQSNLQTPEFSLGLFTRWLIQGLAGGADAAPVGNADGRVDTIELYVYTANMVGEEASVSLGLTQTPIKSDIENLLVGRLEH